MLQMYLNNPSKCFISYPCVRTKLRKLYVVLEVSPQQLTGVKSETADQPSSKVAEVNTNGCSLQGSGQVYLAVILLVALILA